jgi:dipeptidyl aminopeptidase/acylaminoacyl peptidase
MGTVRGKNGGIWISPVGGGTPVRAVEESEENPQAAPSWSPDGNTIAFLISRSGVVGLAKAAVGGGARPEIIKDKVSPLPPPRWSPKGSWILYSMPDGLSLIGSDGKGDRILSKRKWSRYAWSKDGSLVYAIRNEKRHYLLCSIEVESGAEKTVAEFDLPPGTSLGADLSIAPDGKSVATTLNHVKGDIWLLEGFRTPGGLLPRLWRW